MEKLRQLLEERKTFREWALSGCDLNEEDDDFKYLPSDLLANTEKMSFLKFVGLCESRLTQEKKELQALEEELKTTASA